MSNYLMSLQITADLSLPQSSPDRAEVKAKQCIQLADIGYFLNNSCQNGDQYNIEYLLFVKIIEAL